MWSFFDLEIKFTIAIPLNMTKIIGVSEVNFYSKIDFETFFDVLNFLDFCFFIVAKRGLKIHRPLLFLPFLRWSLL